MDNNNDNRNNRLNYLAAEQTFKNCIANARVSAELRKRWYDKKKEKKNDQEILVAATQESMEDDLVRIENQQDNAEGIESSQRIADKEYLLTPTQPAPTEEDLPVEECNFQEELDDRVTQEVQKKCVPLRKRKLGLDWLTPEELKKRRAEEERTGDTEESEEKEKEGQALIEDDKSPELNGFKQGYLQTLKSALRRQREDLRDIDRNARAILQPFHANGEVVSIYANRIMVHLRKQKLTIQLMMTDLIQQIETIQERIKKHDKTSGSPTF